MHRILYVSPFFGMRNALTSYPELGPCNLVFV